MVNAIGFDNADARVPLEAVGYMKAETRYLRRFDDFIKFELLLIILSKEPEPKWNIAVTNLVFGFTPGSWIRILSLLCHHAHLAECDDSDGKQTKFRF